MRTPYYVGRTDLGAELLLLSIERSAKGGAIDSSLVTMRSEWEAETITLHDAQLPRDSPSCACTLDETQVRSPELHAQTVSSGSTRQSPLYS